MSNICVKLKSTLNIFAYAKDFQSKKEKIWTADLSRTLSSTLVKPAKSSQILYTAGQLKMQNTNNKFSAKLPYCPASF